MPAPRPIVRPAARASALAACALALAWTGAAQARARPEPQLPAAPLPAAYASGDATAPLAVLPSAALDAWWTLFRDPTLDALEDEALRSAPDALTAAARLAEAREVQSGRDAATLPSGSIAASASHQRAYDLSGGAGNLSPTGGVVDSASGTFNISWELDLFGRLATARRIARADAAQARFAVEGTRASLAAAVADAYVQAQGLVIQLADARETERIDADLLLVARRRAAAGAAPAVDIDRIAAEAGQAQAQATDLSARLTDARRALTILVGRDLRRLDDLALTGAAPPVPPLPATLPADLLARRPDVREAEYRLRSEIGAAHLAHLAVFPTLTLLPALGVSSTAQPGVSFIPPSTLVTGQQTTTSGFWTLAAGLTVPTLDIPRLLHQARAEDARAREAAIAYQATVRTAFGEAQAALVDVAAGQRAVAELAAAEARAASAYGGVRRGYAGGVDDLTSLLEAERSWRAIRSALTAEEVDAGHRAVRAFKALGGGWAYDEVASAGASGAGR
ncbi:MAG: TolC family protein [Caulobacteraceae bacterium]|nr:TolC family protein [Caulobacteraceae bacterium]